MSACSNAVMYRSTQARLLGGARLVERFRAAPDFLHAGTCPLQGTVNRYHRRAENVCGFRRGEAEHVTKDERTTLARREVLQGGSEGQAQGAAVDHGRSRIALQQGVGQRL